MAQDVWDRDLIEVTYDASKIQPDAMLKVIEKEGFQGSIQGESNKP